MVDEPRSRSTPMSRSRSGRRVALAALIITVSLATLTDGFAQFVANPGPIISRSSPRLPPPVIIGPPNTRAYGPVVIDNLDEYRLQLLTGRRRGCSSLTTRRSNIFCNPTRQTRRTKQTNQIAQRSGFNPPPPGETRFVPDEVLLRMSPGVTTAALEALGRLNHLSPVESQEFALTRHRLVRWHINDGRPVPVVIRSLRDPRILAAQPNYLYTLQEDAPAAAKPDAKAEQPDSAQYAVAKLHLTEAHAIAKGENVLVALIDTPVDATHPDLTGVVTATFDATGEAGKPRPHGTGMASAIAAHGRLIGSAPSVKLLSVVAFGVTRTQGTSFNILKGLQWAADQNANVVNMSFAGPADPELQTMLAATHAKGIALIAAAGNAGPRSPPLYPGADPNVIAVTATDMDDKLFDHANRGNYIAVAAPGVDILVATPDGGYQTTSGTSVAAAEVSGVAALMIERDRKLDPAAVRQLLTSTAHRLGPGDQFGAGLIDAVGALTAQAAGLPRASKP